MPQCNRSDRQIDDEHANGCTKSCRLPFKLPFFWATSAPPFSAYLSTLDHRMLAAAGHLDGSVTGGMSQAQRLRPWFLWFPVVGLLDQPNLNDWLACHPALRPGVRAAPGTPGHSAVPGTLLVTWAAPARTYHTTRQPHVQQAQHLNIHRTGSFQDITYQDSSSVPPRASGSSAGLPWWGDSPFQHGLLLLDISFRTHRGCMQCIQLLAVTGWRGRHSDRSVTHACRRRYQAQGNTLATLGPVAEFSQARAHENAAAIGTSPCTVQVLTVSKGGSTLGGTCSPYGAHPAARRGPDGTSV